jgi:hypothetical protein
MTPTAGKPVVSITSPPNGAQVALGQEVLVQASAVDTTGIARVELRVDGTLTTMAQPPSPQASYAAVLHWTPITLGAHTLMVTAINTGGVASDPAVVAINVVSVGELGRTPSVPTSTPSVPPTNTPITPPTNTPITPPTNTPITPPTNTPITPPTNTPPPPPGCTASIDFRADRTTINAGEHTTLRWDVECVREVYLDGAPVTGHESRDVAPAATTTYTLHMVRNDGGSEDRQVTITVNPVGPPPPPAQPDLYISEYTLTPDPPHMAVPVHVRVGVYNQGNAAAGAFTVQWWATIAAPAPACTWPVASLAAHGGRILECDYTYGGWAPYTTRAVADSGNTVAESNEGNNTQDKTILVAH